MFEKGLSKFLSGGEERSVKARKNIAAMVFIHGGNILAGLLLVPITIRYVDADTYGIWLAISSIIAWFSFFDIGINNGLKNRLTEALAYNDTVLARKYVSTTYALLILIFIPLMILMLVVAPMLDWHQILNLPQGAVNGLLASVCIVITYFCLNFILSTVNVVMQADQWPAGAALRGLIQQLISLAVIFVLTLTTKGSLVKLCIALCACPIVVVSLFNIVLYSSRYKEIAPSLADVDFSTAPSLFKLGIQFFIIQVAGVIQFQMTNFLIIHNFGATEVTEYNVAYKLFNVPYMLWITIVTPVWAAVTDAVAKNDFAWIRGAVKKYLQVFVLFLSGTILLLLISGPLYRIWLGDTVSVSFEMSAWVMVFIITLMYGTIFVHILDGAGILKFQSIACIIAPFVFLGLCFLFIRLGWGVKSIVIASILANFNGWLLAPAQCYSFLKKHA